MEVTKGVAEGLNNPQLTIAEGATIANDDETVTTPTIWEDGVNDCLTGGNLVKVTGVKVGQVFYFNEMPEVNVTSVEELEHALQTNLEVINLTKSFETDHVIIVGRKVAINGNNHTITYNGETGSWSGGSGDNYVMQVYNAEATIKDIGLTGTSAGLLVNASTVTLEGTIDVSRNVFGGIEVSKGTAEGLNNPQLIVSEGAKLVNDNESLASPTIWEDGVDNCVTTDLIKIEDAKEGKDQNFYFNESPIADVANVTELEAALSNARKEIINITENFTTDHVIVVGRAVTINGNKNTITYNGETGSWSGGSGDNYVMQVYNAEATIKDIGLTGTSAGLLVNASTVTLEGTIDVSRNVFGGIEVSKGTAEGLKNSKLTVNGTITMTNEAKAAPVIWIEKDQGTVTGSGVEGYHITTETNDKDQTYYYSDESFATQD